MTDPTFGMHAPQKVTSMAHSHSQNLAVGRAILRELRDRSLRGAYRVFGQDYKLFAIQLKTRDERNRNSKSVTLASITQRLAEDITDKSFDAWTTVG